MFIDLTPGFQCFILRSYEITRKDRLFKNVDRMAHTKGAKHFDFMPKSYLMPSEYQDFCGEPSFSVKLLHTKCHWTSLCDSCLCKR